MKRLGLAVCLLAFALVLLLTAEKLSEADPNEGGVISRILLNLMGHADAHRGRQAEADLRQALEDPGTDSGFSLLRGIVVNADVPPRDAVRRALIPLAEHHAHRAYGANVYARVGRWSDWPEAETFLRAVANQGSTEQQRALALYQLIQLHDRRARASQEPSATRYATADQLRSEFREHYEDVTYDGQVILEKLVQQTESRFVLSLGETVPDIQGQDLDGQTHRLSDHRGKVLVISFSGTWCAPCKPYYPVLRDLQKQHGDAVAVVSIQQDEDVDAVQERIDDGTYTWQVWFEGSHRGPLHAGWGLTEVPMTFVLDRDGVLRSIDPSPEELASVVEQWVDA